MKSISRKLLASLLACAITFTLIPTFLGVSNTALAASTKNKSNTKLGISGISNPSPGKENTYWTGSYVYLGSYEGTPIKFRVLATNSTAQTYEKSLFLDSDIPLLYKRFDDNSNAWDGSELKSYLNGYFLNSYFTTPEKAAIAYSNASAHPLEATSSIQISSGVQTNYQNYVALTGEKIFLLDAEDVWNTTYGYGSSASMIKDPSKHAFYWIRSAYQSSPYNRAGTVTSVGGTSYTNVTSQDQGVAPALNIKQDSILFSSSIENETNAFKLTLLDENLSIAVPTGMTVTAEGTTITVPYEVGGSDLGNNTRVSILILNKEYKAGNTNGASIIYYDALGDASSSSSTFNIPSGYSLYDWGKNYFVYIVAENINGTYESDYASNPVLLKAPEYKITVNGGSASPKTATWEKNVTITAEVPAGKEFVKWQVVSGSVILVNPNKKTTSFTMPAKNVEITAIYTDILYTVTFFNNGYGTTPETQTLTYGNYVNKPTDPTDSVLVFCGWYTDSACTKAFDFNTAVTSNINLYAKWSPKTYSVEFNSNGGSTIASQTIEDGGNVSKPTTPTKTGYSFEGWYTDSACTTPYDFNSTVTTNFTLYAKWTPLNYSIVFSTNGGSNVPSQTVSYGNKITKPSDPTRSGYSFGGWYVDSACITAYNFNNAVSANVTLYAKWTATSTPTPAPTATVAPTATPAPVETPKLTTGVAHVQDIGNVSYTTEAGVLTIGTRGMGKRMEEITINFENTTGLSGTLEYRVHVQDYGWMEWVPAGTKCGTEGESKRIEAIEIRFTGDLADYYSVEYCVHIQDYGDMQGWVKDGALAGTTGESKRIEELKIRIVPKHSGSSMSVKYRVHVQDYGWEGAYASNGQMSGTSGESKRLEGIEIFLDGNQYSGGVKFKTHVQDYGWQGWSYDGEMSGTQGESKRLEGICIELYGEIADYYDIYYRVHAQDIGWMGWAKNGECAGTAGRSARLEGIQIVLVPKGSPAPDATYEGITAVTETPFVEGF